MISSQGSLQDIQQTIGTLNHRLEKFDEYMRRINQIQTDFDSQRELSTKLGQQERKTNSKLRENFTKVTEINRQIGELERQDTFESQQNRSILTYEKEQILQRSAEWEYQLGCIRNSKEHVRRNIENLQKELVNIEILRNRVANIRSQLENLRTTEQEMLNNQCSS